jgi:hypothetical protein
MWVIVQGNDDLSMLEFPSPYNCQYQFQARSVPGLQAVKCQASTPTIRVFTVLNNSRMYTEGLLRPLEYHCNWPRVKKRKKKRRKIELGQSELT